MVTRNRLVPLIVASPVFLQNIDTSAIATALPSIAESLHVPPLHVNLAITTYLLSLAIFLPLSGWIADRFGAKRVFCVAIALFSLGSALCGAANSLPVLVVCRVLQGLGGAMMLPVGRLILLRAVPRSQLVSAMVWYTLPPIMGRMMGPLFGGIIVTLTSWRWIFLINIPLGLIAIFLALRFVEDTARNEAPAPFDIKGFVLLAVGLCGLMGSLETAGKAFAPVWVSGIVAGIGFLALWLYYLHGSRQTHPIIDLNILRFRTYRTNVIGGMPLRIAVGAAPFLLPLMLQLGFGLSPLTSGLLTVATSIGGLSTRLVMKRAILSIGFRNLLVGATTLTGLSYISYSQFSPSTPHLLMFITLMLGGLVNSLSMVTLGTLGYSEIPKLHMSHGTTLASMIQQLSVSFGVVLGATSVGLAVWWHEGDAAHLQARDFSPAFVVVGLLTMVSLCFFLRLHPKEGAELQ